MQGSSIREPNAIVESFVQTCRKYLSRTRQVQNGSLGPRTIEMTITYKEGVTYGREVVETLVWLSQPAYYTPTRLVVVYKTPTPDVKTNRESAPEGVASLEDLFLKDMLRENGVGDEAGTRCGILLRPLEEEAFEKHVRELEWY